jgi:hypothetical protein
MDRLGRLWAEKKQWSAAALAPFLSGERLWAVVVLGVALIGAVCWLDHRTKDEGDVEIETPFLSLRRGSSKRSKQKKDDAKT